MSDVFNSIVNITRPYKKTSQNIKKICLMSQKLSNFFKIGVDER